MPNNHWSGTLDIEYSMPKGYQSSRLAVEYSMPNGHQSCGLGVEYSLPDGHWCGGLSVEYSMTDSYWSSSGQEYSLPDSHQSGRLGIEYSTPNGHPLDKEIRIFIIVVIPGIEYAAYCFWTFLCFPTGGPIFTPPVSFLFLSCISLLLNQC